jgi:predicted phage baseplate assembly protein
MTEQTAQVSFTPATIDYTNRDFYSLREDLIARVKDRIPGWYGSDPSDFGVALVEAFAYLGDVTGYYIDRVANENTLSTASQRASVINLAQTYGYTPAGYQAALTTLTFRSTQPATWVIPAKSVVYGVFVDGDLTRQISFSTQTATTLNPPVAITGVNRTAASTATVLTVGSHNFFAGSSIFISGLTGTTAELNSTLGNTVTAVAGTGSAVTYTAANNFVVGQLATVTGASVTGFNVTDAVITAVTPTSFTIANSTTGASSAAVIPARFWTVASSTTTTLTLTTTKTTAISSTSLSGTAISAVGGSILATAIHGKYISSENPAVDSSDVAGELLGQSTGTPAQAFTLTESPVVDNTVRIFVKNGASYSEWTYVLNLVDYGPSDTVFTTFFDENDYVTVLFGDGVSGVIPPRAESIKAEYLVGGGTIGNIPVAQTDGAGGTAVSGLTSWYYVPGLTSGQLATLSSAVTVSNTTSGAGGANPDSIETMKVLAPLAFASLNRAVTLDDYASLALQLPTVGKANAISEKSSSVTLYVGPRQGPTVSDPYPLYIPPSDNISAPTELTTAWDAGDGTTGLKYDTIAALTGKTQIGVSLTILPVTYTLLKLSVLYTKLPQYTDAQVVAQINALLEAYYSYTVSSFGQTIYPGDIELLLRYAPGVANVSVVSLYKNGSTISRSILMGQPNEVFILTTSAAGVSGVASTTTLTSALSLCTLLGLTQSTGTRNPVTWDPAFYNYSLAVTSATTSVTLTPTTTTSDYSTIYVNDVVYASGAAVAIAVANVAVSAVSGSGTVITYTAPTATLKVGQLVTVTGATIAGYNVVNAPIASVTGTAFTVVSTATGATSTATVLPTTNVAIRVVAQDGTTLKNYAVIITKS